jgi:hypothetical protein
LHIFSGIPTSALITFYFYIELFFGVSYMGCSNAVAIHTAHCSLSKNYHNNCTTPAAVACCHIHHRHISK